MLRLAAALEGLDDDHAAAAARAWLRQYARLVDCCFGRVGLFWARRHGEQLASVRNVRGSVGTGEQPIVSDAMEALGQHPRLRGGGLWIRKRRMNSSVASVIVL